MYRCKTGEQPENMSEGIAQLYASILRLHRLLPSGQARFLGDSYVKNEFRVHKKKANPEQLATFVTAWTEYRDTLRSQLGRTGWLGADLQAEEVSRLSDEQILDVQKLKDTLRK